MDRKLERLQKMIEESRYTVVLSGSGMLAECGNTSLKTQERAYDIEETYGSSPEYIFTSAYYNTRTEQFFHFYKEEILKKIPEPTESFYVLAEMERAGKLDCIVTANMFDLCQRAGCTRMIDLHGSIYRNRCPHCGKEFDKDYILEAEGVPRCDVCGTVVRPQLTLFGEMMDSQLVAETAEEIDKADLLILLGTTLSSEVYVHYVRYFEGRHLVIIHRDPHHSDEKADLVILKEPREVLPCLKLDGKKEKNQGENS